MSESPPRSLLAIAIERENWELAALCILVAAVETVRSLPPDGAESLLELLEADVEPRRRRRGRRRGRRH